VVLVGGSDVGPCAKGVPDGVIGAEVVAPIGADIDGVVGAETLPAKNTKMMHATNARMTTPTTIYFFMVNGCV